MGAAVFQCLARFAQQFEVIMRAAQKGTSPPAFVALGTLIPAAVPPLGAVALWLFKVKAARMLSKNRGKKCAGTFVL
jgi:hypothetical protein